MSIKNITNLVKAYFIENWKNDILRTASITAALAMIFCLVSPLGHIDFLQTYAILMVILFTARLFFKLSKTNSRINFLMLPASNSEKVLTNMLLCNIYFVVLVFASLLFGTIIAYVILSIMQIPGLPSLIDFLKMHPYVSKASIITMYWFIALLFFGHIYFKKNPSWKTMGILVLVILAVAAIAFLTFRINVAIVAPHNGLMMNHFNFSINDNNIGEAGLYAIWLGSIIYFYALSFLRLKETEA